MNSSMSRYLNESLKISVNALLIKSLISGFTNGNVGCHRLLIAKSAVLSMSFRPLNRSVTCIRMSSKRSISMRTLMLLPGPPTRVTLVVWLDCGNTRIFGQDAINCMKLEPNSRVLIQRNVPFAFRVDVASQHRRLEIVMTAEAFLRKVLRVYESIVFRIGSANDYAHM